MIAPNATASIATSSAQAAMNPQADVHLIACQASDPRASIHAISALAAADTFSTTSRTTASDLPGGGASPAPSGAKTQPIRHTSGARGEGGAGRRDARPVGGEGGR